MVITYKSLEVHLIHSFAFETEQNTIVIAANRIETSYHVIFMKVDEEYSNFQSSLIPDVLAADNQPTAIRGSGQGR